MFEHKITNVEKLHTDSLALYTDVVIGTADGIIGNLSSAVDNLKANWQGADAGVNIQSIVEIHNDLVVVRNALAALARDSAKVAVQYRDIQISNRAPLGSLGLLNITDKTALSYDPDTSDTVNINGEAEVGRKCVSDASGSIDTFISEAKTLKDEILGNWTVGTGRNNADTAFSDFVADANKKKETLNEVSDIIAKAIQNYSF